MTPRFLIRFAVLLASRRDLDDQGEGAVRCRDKLCSDIFIHLSGWYHPFHAYLLSDAHLFRSSPVLKLVIR
ncbi:hypothetical protein VTK73DRAFT_7106 [Phialemonium thermophilum]|uniref:Secreted protein n=1 Tax=Phialemonium thermophilum TaxID=223376 RepID=A0ABR3XUN0_9PEZI